MYMLRLHCHNCQASIPVPASPLAGLIVLCGGSDEKLTPCPYCGRSGMLIEVTPSARSEDWDCWDFDEVYDGRLRVARRPRPTTQSGSNVIQFPDPMPPQLEGQSPDT